MNQRIFAAASTCLLLVTGSAGAQAEDWTGIYLGVGGGLGIAKHDLSAGAAIDDPLPVAAAASIDGLGGDGGLFTLGVGADYQVNRNILIGAFFDYDWFDADTKIDVAADALGAAASASAKFNIENQWSVGGRIGFLPTNRTLLFGSAGYTQVDISDLTANAALVGVGGEGGTVASIGTLSGYFLGGGAEVKLTDAVSIKGEYRYTDLGSEALELTPDLAALAPGLAATIDPTIQTGRVSLNYRFGLGHSASDPIEDTPVDTGGGTWTGVYLGIGGGYAIAKQEANLAGAVPGDVGGALAAGIDGIGSDGGQFTLATGGDYQVNRSFLIGAFFDYSWLDADTTAKVAASVPGLLDASASIEGELENQWVVGGRLGYLPTSRTLLFVSAGYTEVEASDVTFRADLTGLGAASGVLASVGTFSGYVLGAGAEVKLTDAISLKGEYRYTDLGSEDATLLPNILPTINEVVTTTVDPTIQTGLITLNYRFNWEQPAAAPLK